MAVHLMIDNGPRAFANSKEIEKRAEAAAKVLWSAETAEKLFQRAVAIITKVTGGELDRDHVRTQAITNAIVDLLRPKPTAPAPKSGEQVTADV